jgi:hypothetical protein
LATPISGGLAMSEKLDISSQKVSFFVSRKTVDMSVKRKQVDHFFFLFICCLNFPEYLNVTVFLAGNIKSSPVEGFLPFRFFLPLTQNLPNPLTKTSSPDSRDDLIIPIIFSIDSEDFFLSNPRTSLTIEIIPALVKAMVGFSILH